MNINNSLSALFLLVCLNLVACAAVGPDYTTPSTILPEEWNQATATTDSAIVTDKVGDLSQWWLKLEDQLLADLVREALHASPNLKSALAKLREARARSLTTQANLYPTVSASGAGSSSRSSEETGSGSTRELYSVGFDASWELDIFGKVRRSVEAAEADYEVSEANLYNTQVSLAAEVATNYIEVRSLQVRLDIARKNLNSQSETLQLTEWRAKAGLVSSQDVEQALSNKEQTRAQIPSLETSLAEAEHRLDILLGYAPGTLHERLASTGQLPTVPKEIAIGIPAETLRQRPDIKASERKLAAETARVGVAEAARYPTFKLSGSIGLEALTLSGLGNSGATTSSLLGAITSPIFNAGRLRNQVEIQDAVREQALIEYEQTILKALQDVENALVAFEKSRERSEVLQVATESAANSAEMGGQRYAAGLIDFQSVLDSERSVRSLEDSLAISRTNSLLALVSLYKALGGGWTEMNESNADIKETS